MTALAGRDEELAAIDKLLGRLPGAGAALAVSGPRGSGRSAVLAAAGARAAARGLTVLRTAGAEAERDLPYAALHQLLRPLRAELPALAAPRRAALDAVFGHADPASAEAFLVSLGTFELLSRAAARAPVVVLADQTAWLDDATLAVLAFVTRRLDAEPVALLTDGPLADAEIAPLPLAPLGDAAAQAVLAGCAPALGPLACERIAEEACGNPLALTELAKVVDGLDEAALVGGDLPLTPALEDAFAPGLSDLDPATRRALLRAALQTEPPPDPDLAGALGAGLVTLDGGRVTFGHGLTRVAVRRAATPEEHRAAHRALATLTDEHRAAWHLACATDDPDEQLAAALERSADHARAEGELDAAAARLRRAATLSEQAAARDRRQLAAAELVLTLGGRALARQLLAGVLPAALGPRERCRHLALTERLDPRPRYGAHRFGAVVELALAAGEAGATDEALNLLWITTGASIAADGAATAREPLLAAVRAVAGHDPHPAALATYSVLSPFDHGPEILEGLAAHRVAESDPDTAHLLGSAALVVGDVATAERQLRSAVAGMRAQRRIADRADALAMLAYIEADSGRLGEAVASGEEALAVATSAGRPMAATIAHCALALAAGARGDEQAVDAHTTAATRIAFPAGASIGLARSQLARASAALAARRPAEAYQHLVRIFDAADPAHDRLTCLAAIGDLAEAAAGAGEADEARALLAQIEPPSIGLGDRTKLAVGQARLVLAPDDELDAAAADVLAVASWPFHRARLQLIHGMRLRRLRRVADSREPLREAHAAFTDAGATPWAECARQELAATVESSHRGADITDRLTPRELEIARMAAQGLSNRDIGERLALSPRTVGSHLARIFPKLDVTSRTEIAGALDGVTRSG